MHPGIQNTENRLMSNIKKVLGTANRKEKSGAKARPQFDHRFSFGPVGDGGAPASSWPPALQVTGGGEERAPSHGGGGGSRPWKRTSRASVVSLCSPASS